MIYYNNGSLKYSKTAHRITLKIYLYTINVYKELQKDIKGIICLLNSYLNLEKANKLLYDVIFSSNVL